MRLSKLLIRLHSDADLLFASSQLFKRSYSIFQSINELLQQEESLSGRDKRLVDNIVITVKSGAGGNGCSSLWRSPSKGKFAPADGGNGGNGGNVIIKASSHMKSLAGVQQLYKAGPGTHGSKQKQHGKTGSDCIITVPVGTTVSRIIDHTTTNNSIEEEDDDSIIIQQQNTSTSTQPLDEQEDLPDWIKNWKQPWTGATDYHSDSTDEEGGEQPSASTTTRNTSRNTTSKTQKQQQQIADLIRPGQEILVATGGQGGRGNAAFKALPNRPAPTTAEKGEPPQTVKLRLELKLIADVALVGLPNAGKSTLLAALTAATPRIGAYPFTTLIPQLGTIPSSNNSSTGRKNVTIADVPGLIQGAHLNRGLGLAFLRHIERTRALVYVLDGTPRHPVSMIKQFKMLREELKQYSSQKEVAVDDVPMMVLVNKSDLVGSTSRQQKRLEKLKEQIQSVVGDESHHRIVVAAVSAKTGAGLEELVDVINKTLVLPVEN